MARRSSGNRTAKAKSATWSTASSTKRKSSSSAPSVPTAAGSSRRVERGAMKEKDITLVSRDDPRRGKTDWAKVAKLTDEEIEAAMAKDPAWADYDDARWSEAGGVRKHQRAPGSCRRTSAWSFRGAPKARTRNPCTQVAGIRSNRGHRFRLSRVRARPE